MSAMSDYLELKVLDHVLGTTAFTAPSAVYLGLSTESFGDDNSGTELTGNNYSRKAITFASASSGTTSNDSTIEFNAATGAWGTVSHWALFDAASSGNLLIHGTFSASKVIATGDIVRVATGDLDITAA